MLHHGLGQAQAGLLHQRRHRQPLGKEGCFQLLHGAATEQQMLEVGGGPGHAFRMEGRGAIGPWLKLAIRVGYAANARSVCRKSVI